VGRLIGIGLLGFVAWRLAQSITDADGQGTNSKGLAIRALLFGSAVTYLGLAGYAIGHAFSARNDSGGSGEKGLAEWVMSQPFGSYIAIAIGIGLAVGGGVTSVKGATRKFEKYIHIPDRHPHLHLYVRPSRQGGDFRRYRPVIHLRRSEGRSSPGGWDRGGS
jgi:hypothetical protein